MAGDIDRRHGCVRFSLSKVWKYMGCRHAFICCLVVLVPLYYFISAVERRHRDKYPDINCSLVGEKNFVPNWTSNYANNGYVKLESTSTSPSSEAKQALVVPNIVHYIWYSDAPKPFKFHHLLSMLSAYKIIKPRVIFFHTNMEPTGKYWDEARKIRSLQIIHRQPSLCLFGYPLKAPYYETSASNVDRLRVLFETGGIYLDLDVLAVRPFDPLREYACTIGLESADRACGGIAICAKDAAFLTLWINSYLDNYDVRTWAYNTGKVPYHLWRRYPHLVHVESSKLNRPNCNELDQIYGDKIIDWQDKYSVHLWYRVWQKSKLYQEEPNMQNIKTMNSTFGQIARWIIYNTTAFVT